jgi:hypothetical protein
MHTATGAFSVAVATLGVVASTGEERLSQALLMPSLLPEGPLVAPEVMRSPLSSELLVMQAQTLHKEKW